VLVLSPPGGLGEALARRLGELGVFAQLMTPPSDRELGEILRQGFQAVAVVTHDDVLALRLALLCARVRRDLSVWVTLFDRSVAHQLQAIVPTVRIVPTAELAAGGLADLCLAVAAPRRARGTPGVRLVDDALRLLVKAGAGLIATLLVQTAISLIALRESLLSALYFSTRSVATVADVPGAASAPSWYMAVSALDTIAAVVLVAIFTAALVRRLSRPRLTTLAGRRRAPARGHVIIVGFGQVGFRLAQLLNRRRIPVLAVERTAEAPAVRLAAGERIPLAIGRGDDRAMLELAGVRRCAAVAAVTSDDLTNVAVGLTARDIVPTVPLVLRLGDGDVAAETESLLHLGSVCDVHRLTSGILAEEIHRQLSSQPAGAHQPPARPPVEPRRPASAPPIAHDLD